MKSFSSLGDFAVHLAGQEVTFVAALHAGLVRAATKVEETAKGEFGEYQPAVGPHPGWPELADATKEDRVRQGFTENAPLLRSGEARDSIEKQVGLLEAVIGSKDERLLYFELGTAKMPARPVLGPAGWCNKDTILKLVGGAALAGLVGNDVIHSALGYDMDLSRAR